jgi:hypothetical protein
MALCDGFEDSINLSLSSAFVGSKSLWAARHLIHSSNGAMLVSSCWILSHFLYSQNTFDSGINEGVRVLQSKLKNDY